MPYIGNSHIVGDHINNFKVLDDISSYTATFDGSSTDVVSTANETLRIAEHRFVQGQRVTYNNGGGSNIGGLASGTAYYVSFDTTNTIKLATSLVNANNGTLINLTSAGGGTTHTLTAAFDGINTKFKLTHNGGESGRLNNATQLQVAINNVLQRPNSDPDNFTEGFAVEGGNKIVFQTAPTSNDIFWGSIIANSLPTFDIDAAAIDNFTGDGSATDFTLSRIPPNNASIIVTINGVFQHLSDPTTARAYSLEASVIKFTSAPASGDEIQVRHTGFRGALGDIVTGFYGRTGNVSLIASDDILTRNINSSGIITASKFVGPFDGTGGNFSGVVTATSANFTGNVTIGGTLTYEDVTNIDSVGIITAQKDIHVGAGLSVVGVSTLGTSGSVFLQHNGTTRLQTSSAGVLINGAAYIENNGSNIKAAGLGINNSIFHNGDENTAMDFSDNDRVRFRTNGAERLAITNTGIHFNVVGISTFVGNIDANGDLDVDGHTNLDNLDVVGVATFTGSKFDIQSTGESFVTRTGGGSSSIVFVVSGNASEQPLIEFRNGGTGIGDIKKIGTTGIRLRSDTLALRSYSGDEKYLEAVKDGAVELYHDNTKRLETTATGIKVTGTTATGSVFLGDFRVKNTNDTNFVTFKPAESLVRWHDNHKAVFGGSNDFQLFHNGTDNFIRTENGSIRVTNYGENMAKFIPNGAVELYHDNIKRLETSSVGVSIPQDLDVDGHTNLDNVNIAGVVTATSYYGDGSNLSNVISGVDVKFEGASVGTGVTMLNFVGFNTVTPPASGLSTITSGQNLTIGVRSGSAVEASLTGTSFNVIARSGGNISINI